jgi:excisionase family DNA binding protein
LSDRLLNTEEAARFLRVSEASIRRWSDAGILPSRRVGGRRERRFREADLVAYLGAATSTSVRQGAAAPAVNMGGVALPLHSHLATFYNSDAGRLRPTIPFFAEGIRAGQPCFLAADGKVLEKYFVGLRKQGIDIDSAIQSGQFVVAIDGPGSTVEGALDYWERQFWPALTGGQTVLRVVGEMACERKAFASDAELMRYETAFNMLAKRFPTVTLCQFDVREFDGETIFQAIRAHPDMFSLYLGSFIN